jgi:transcription antitermination factor NusG
VRDPQLNGPRGKADEWIGKNSHREAWETIVNHHQDYASLEFLYETPHWYAVHTCANREKLISKHLASRGIEHFLPLYESVREWSDRRMKLELPLFPGYLFVYTALRHRMPIVTVPGVVNLVGVAGQPAPLSTQTIVSLKDGIRRVAAQPYPYLPVGQPVSIRSGPLKGLSGVLVRHKSGPRVVISIDMLERSFLADVAVQNLVPIGPIMGLESISA